MAIPQHRPQTGFGYRDPSSPLDHLTMATQQLANNDHLSQYMYEIPIQEKGDRGGESGQEIDPDLLSSRLRHLGLHQPSNETLDSPFRPQKKITSQSTEDIFSPGLHQYPTVAELRPQDSISVMYQPYRPRSERKGGTNVDPGEDKEQPSPEGEDDSLSIGYGSGYGGMTMATPRSMQYLDQPTVPAASVWTGDILPYDMYNHRDRLLSDAKALQTRQTDAIQRQIDDTAQLATALAKLETAEERLRTLQATLIAERVARTQVENDKRMGDDESRECRDELAGAVRALRRARDEGKKGDEERRRLARCFEETKIQLFKYHEELKVRDARARGREEGRQEAWKEAEMWLGGAPPIPVDPVRQVPNAVLHQTPMMSDQQPLPNSQLQQSQQQRQQSQQQRQQSQQQQQQSQRQGQYQTPPQQAVHYQSASGQGYSQAMVDRHQEQTPRAHHQQGPTPRPQNHSQLQSTHTMSPMPQLRPQQMTSGMQPEPTGRSSHRPGPTPIQPHDAQSHLGPQYTAQQMQPHQTGQTGMTSQPPMYDRQPQQQNTATGMAPQHLPGFSTPPHLVGIPHSGPSGQPQQSMMTPATQQGSVPPPQPVQGPYEAPSRSVPPRDNPLPGSHLPRAATMVNQSRRAPDQSHRRAVSNGVHAPQPDSVRRPHPADSYLDRADQDPRLKHMLADAPSKSVHTSAFPSEYSREPTHHDAPVMDKPLPNPFASQEMLGRSASARRPSTGVTAGQSRSRRISLMEGLHPRPHPNQNQDGDRYPIFPGIVARGQSRRSSVGSVDPANYALPTSALPSMTNTPQSARPINGYHSSRQTPESSSTRGRSRMAGALRHDTDMDPGELSQIEEAEEEHRRSHVAPEVAERQEALKSSKVMQNVHQQKPHQSYHRTPSMPPMRWQPRMPVMPPKLGHKKPGSEPHPQGPRPSASMQQMYMRQAAERLPDPRHTDPSKSHPNYVPPGVSLQALGESVEDVSGPRHSALGLEGLESRTGSVDDMGGQKGIERGHGFGSGGAGISAGASGMMKAPTIMVQPPSSRSKSPQPRVHNSARASSPDPPQSSSVHTTAQRHPHGQTHKNTESSQYTLPRAPAQPQPHDMPLPTSRAPTYLTGYTPDVATVAAIRRQLAQSVPHQGAHHSGRLPHDIPLPTSRSHAPTEYTARSPDSAGYVSPPAGKAKTVRTMPSVTAIDYGLIARDKALPESRGTTVLGSPRTGARATGIAAELDPEAPNKKDSTATRVKRKPVPATTVDAKHVPLTASRAPTYRARASTYARTEGTIDEVTEEESGRENRGRRKH